MKNSDEKYNFEFKYREHTYRYHYGELQTLNMCGQFMKILELPSDEIKEFENMPTKNKIAICHILLSSYSQGIQEGSEKKAAEIRAALNIRT